MQDLPLDLPKPISLKRRVQILLFVVLSSSILLTEIVSAIFPTVFSSGGIVALFMAMIFAGITILFNSVLWRWSIFARLGGVVYPDLSGRWEGQFTSSRNDYSQIMPATIFVKQTWLTFDVYFYSETGYSQALAFTMQRGDEEGHVIIYYIYEVYPIVDNKWRNNSQPYRGLTTLTLREKDVISGYYEYYDRINRRSVNGQLYFERKSNWLTTLGDDPRRLV